MSTRSVSRLTPTQRLTRGLAHTAAGPVDVTRGALGLTAQSVAATASGIRRRYRASKLKRDLADAQIAVRHEIAAAQEAVATLPQTLADARGSRRGRRLLIGAAAGAAVLAGGAALFSVVRRSRKPEPSTLPPSVHVEPKP
jgi:Cell wall synthesis protein CwsA